MENNNIDMDKVRKNLKDDKYNVLKISLDCDRVNYSFDAAEEIEIGDISISKKDIICADNVNKYFIIINGYEDLN